MTCHVYGGRLLKLTQNDLYGTNQIYDSKAIRIL